MRAIVIVQKDGKKYGYGFSSSRKSAKEFLKAIHEACEGYEIVSMNVR